MRIICNLSAIHNATSCNGKHSKVCHRYCKDTNLLANHNKLELKNLLVLSLMKRIYFSIALSCSLHFCKMSQNLPFSWHFAISFLSSKMFILEQKSLFCDYFWQPIVIVCHSYTPILPLFFAQKAKFVQFLVAIFEKFRRF